ncbi:ABC transporter ATP-binding protein [Celerinatantimonas diazotrophica]|uniref:Peptide/nickel transport system ATP-binding protein n=1 Tax=Celerinatantimonas diazotrophica TaxID=412034 RepID=A0A4R1K1A3_9GAMM|nr:oligopeptide/dipeptide ABC transporter ATP-binding protein [Celerinatantimonas diazotrophica]TCK57776.1 peptide/nickel transport system ATP-binding protein [Celerinatantimonas diazotrophica]CAG9298160.1 putative D,D-dipeptide transport ATP-binding protein DdpF [Celerinatantimonas diazotrophica]
MSCNPVLEVKGLSKQYVVKRSFWGKPLTLVSAIRGIDLTVRQGETLGIVGESGCGKSTLARMLVGLHAPTEGTITLGQNQLQHHDSVSLGKEIQYIFQDPISSLNPRKTIRQTMEAPLKYLFNMPKQERVRVVNEMFDRVSLRREFLERYPHEFSGGQAQRIGVARALVCNPKVLVLDEPVSALDVSVQAQVLNLLAELKESLDLTYLFISHDLAVIEAVADRVAVLYFGEVVEMAPAEKIFSAAHHPYTKLLANSAPVVGRKIQVPVQASELPDPINPPQGCAFASRCPQAQAKCREHAPKLQPFHNDAQVQFACHYPLNVE